MEISMGSSIRYNFAVQEKKRGKTKKIKITPGGERSFYKIMRHGVQRCPNDNLQVQVSESPKAYMISPRSGVH